MSSDTWDSTEQVLQLRRSPRLRGLVDDPALEPWTDDATLRRYLRAREGNISKASKMLQASLEWRRSESPQTTTCSKCAAQPLSHNMRVVGFDEERRPVLYVSFGQAWDRFEEVLRVFYSDNVVRKLAGDTHTRLHDAVENSDGLTMPSYIIKQSFET